MTKALERARSHYNRAGLRPIKVPEWTMPGEKEHFTVYAKPLTLNERDAIVGHQQGDQSSLRLYITVVIRKSCDAEGNKLFTEDDDRELETKTDGAVLTALALAIMAPADPVDLEKN